MCLLIFYPILASNNQTVFISAANQSVCVCVCVTQTPLIHTFNFSQIDLCSIQLNQQQVHYHVEGGWGALSVDTVGGVRLWNTLDREAPGGGMGFARVVAMDEGHPSLSSTATLTITVTDVNDCPPRLLPPTILHVTEGAPASLLGVLTATDDDVWELGHGPPFNFTLALSNPAHILNTLSIKYYTSEYQHFSFEIPVSLQ